MVNVLSHRQRSQLNDRILANHFTDLKFIDAFARRRNVHQREYYLFKDRFCLKNFLQEFNIIRNVTSDIKGTAGDQRNICRLSNLLFEHDPNPDNIDVFARILKAEGVSHVNPISLTSKMFFLANPQNVFIYDSLVKTAIGFKKNAKVSYTQFYERISQVLKHKDFNDYIDRIESELLEQLSLLEAWANKPHGARLRRKRIIDRYLIFLGINEWPLTA